MKIVKNLIRNKDFYKTQSRNYYHQLIVFKKKLISSKDEFKKIRQVNKELQQEINEMKIVNKIIFFQRRKNSFRFFLFAENARHNISNINILILTRKSRKHFDFEFFINCQKNLK